jgi:hypothetical protein
MRISGLMKLMGSPPKLEGMLSGTPFSNASLPACQLPSDPDSRTKYCLKLHLEDDLLSEIAQIIQGILWKPAMVSEWGTSGRLNGELSLAVLAYPS